MKHYKELEFFSDLAIMALITKVCITIDIQNNTNKYLPTKLNLTQIINNISF